MQAVILEESVSGTIDSFTSLDKSGDKNQMTALAQRIGKEQPALLQYAAKVRGPHGDSAGEASVFYATLVWAMFEKQFGKKVPRLLPQNMTDAEKIVADDRNAVANLSEKPVHERVAPGVLERQPHLMARIQDLVAEDVRESAITAEVADVIYLPLQVVVEAFDAAISGKRPGQNLAPIVRD